MDPDKALQRLRIYIEALKIYDAECQESSYTDTGILWDIANDVSNSAQALDEWLSKGGFLPQEWAGDRS